ncbi:MAG: DUF6055 domain-containing protein [Pseudomonadota bacterium]
MPLALPLLLAFAAQAADHGVAQPVTREGLLAAFDAAVASPLDPERRPACLTGLVMDLKANWELLTPADQQRVAGFLAPWKGDGLSVRGALRGDAPPAPPPATHDAPCFGHQSSNYRLTDHFSIEWESDADADLVDAFAEALEHSFQREVNELGWTRPLGTDQYPMLAYLAHDDRYQGAYTTVDRCSNIGYVPYIVAYSGSWASASWADTMAAHEFNHTIQFSTSYAPEFWYWEATAIWMEEQVYPAANWWAYYVEAYTQRPDLGLTASDDRDQTLFYHMYGAAIFNFLLDNWFGGPDLVRQMWEDASHEWSQYDYPVWENVEGIGLDWEEVYRTFLAANTVMDYTEHATFPTITRHEQVTSLPGEGASSASDEPQSLGANYIRFDDSLAAGGDLHVTIQVESGPEQWFVQLVSVEGSEVGEVVPIDVSSGEGDAWIAFRGDDVYLVVSPWDDDAMGYHYDWTSAPSWSYTWQAELGDGGTGDTGGDDTGYERIDDPPVRPEDGESHVITPPCSCATGHGPAGGVLLGLLALAGAAVRRQR